MMKLFLAMTSLMCFALASAAADRNWPSFFELDNNLINEEEDTQHSTEKVTQTTDHPKQFNDLTTTLPNLPYVNSCAYPGTCPSLSDTRNCQRCQAGYVKDPEDDSKCKYGNENESAFLLTSAFDYIRVISLDGKNSTQVMQNEQFSESRGIDYNFRTNTIFWFDSSDTTIYTAPLQNYVDSAEKRVTHHTNSSDIHGIAVDWIYNHIYWVDKGRNELVVSNFNGTMKKVLFSDGLTWPLTIVVNPLSGWMYWADSIEGHIERASMDGLQREVILSREIYDPQGLALDLVENRLYWSQKSVFSSIWSSDVDGSNRRMIFKSAEESQLTSFDFRKIALFDKYVYLMDWTFNVIYKVNKCDGQKLEIVNNTKFSLWDFKMYHSSMQPEGENLCSKRIEQCSHFCFPAPSLRKSSISVSTTTCACPDGLYLSSDRQNCVSELPMGIPA